MTQKKETDKGEFNRVKELIIANPGLVLDDVKVLQALAAVQNEGLGTNVIDGRGIAFNRLEQKLKHVQMENQLLKDVLHENSEAMHRIHFAALTLLEVKDSRRLADFLTGELPNVMKVEQILLLLDKPLKGKLRDLLADLAKSPVDASVRRAYLDPVRGTPDKIVLRQVSRTPTPVYGEIGPPIRSEALLPIMVDGSGMIGILAIGSSEPESFKPHMSTELLELIRQVFTITVARLAA